LRPSIAKQPARLGAVFSGAT